MFVTSSKTFDYNQDGGQYSSIFHVPLTDINGTEFTRVRCNSFGVTRSLTPLRNKSA